MELDSLIDTLAHRGIKLAAKGNTLEIDAPKGAITTDLKDALASHKPEILRLLHQNNETVSFRDLPAIIPEPESRSEPFPLTDMQYAFWVGRSGILELGNVANHGYYEIEGEDLDVERLNWALQQLIERHDMLRAIVLPDGRQQIQQTVPPYQMQTVDLRGREADVARKKLQEIRDRLSHQVVPADRWPLFEFRATLLDQGRVRLHISYDLQVFDAWSLFRLFDEWVQLYQDPALVLPALELSFRDYVLAEQALQETELFKRSQTYWFDRIDSLPPAPDLPLAKTPQELKQHICKRFAGGLEPDQWQQLKQRGEKIGLTPSGILLAAFAEIITVWSKNPKFTLNLALFNRLPLHSQVNDILGDFTSVNLLAVDNSHPESFAERAVRLQKQLWQDLEHRYFSGVRVVRELARSQGAAPSAMPVIFTSTLGFSSLGQETLTFSHFGDLVYGISQASQAWMDIQVWSEKGALTFNWDVVTGLFPEGLIADMFETYCHFLKQLAVDETAWQETKRQLVPPKHLAQQCLVNATAAPVSEKLLPTLFAEQVSLRNNQPAVISQKRTLSYQELSELSNQVGHKLRSLGVTPNQLVAVVMEKGWSQIVAVMGILNSGAAYVPIAPDLPPERFAYLIEDSQVNLVLTQSKFKDQLALPPGVKQLCLDSDPDLLTQSKQPLESVQTPDDLAYVIYTSGSTGKPKGVMITHRNVVNVVVHTNQRFKVSSQDSILALTALNHDLSVYDIFGLLSAGGKVIIPDAERVKDPSHWLELMKRSKVTLWNSVPAMMEMLVDYTEGQSQSLPESLRLTILGGDWLPVPLPDRIRALASKLQILSIGGPTETTIWNIGYLIEEVDPNWKSIPYGQPMANSKYYILNEALEDCPMWVAGEMYCGGVQLSPGYWRNEAKTKANFITHPRTGERIYRTGDLGRYLPALKDTATHNGKIEFLGRVDFQLKIRGYRIEAGEIEAALTQHPAVKAAIVTMISQQQDQERLLAYLVADKTTASVEELRNFLKHKLPEYMLPSAFIFLESLPLSANGKVDRRALPHPQTLPQQLEADYVAPQNNVEETIAAVWQEVLDQEKIGVNDNFFEIGGNSLLVAKTYNRLKDALPNQLQEISLINLFKYFTIRSLAQHINQHRPETLPEAQNSKLVEQLSAGKSRLRQRFNRSKIANL